MVDGESLANIAQSIYGDSSLWYIIADTNATTFQPYNPAEIIGDLTPDPKTLPPPKKSCNAFAIILVVVVAIVVTVVTAGAAGPAIAAAMPALAGTASTVAGAFVAGVAGSLASQAVGVALGVSDGINLRQAFASGLTGAFTAGIGSALSSSGSAFVNSAGDGLNLAGNIVQGAGSVAAGAVANKIAGLDSGFSWRAVAAGAIAGGISGSLGLNSSTDTKTGLPKADEFSSAFGKGFASAAVSSLTRKAVGLDRDRSYGEIAADAFGNGLASGLSARYDLYQKGRDFGNRAVGNITDAQQAKLNHDAMVQIGQVSDELSDKLKRENDRRINEVVAQAMVVKDRISGDQLDDTEVSRAEQRQAQLDGLVAAGNEQDQRLANLESNEQSINEARQGASIEFGPDLTDGKARIEAELYKEAQLEKAQRMIENAKLKRESNTLHASGKTIDEWNRIKASEVPTGVRDLSMYPGDLNSLELGLFLNTKVGEYIYPGAELSYSSDLDGNFHLSVAGFGSTSIPIETGLSDLSGSKNKSSFWKRLYGDSVNLELGLSVLVSPSATAEQMITGTSTTFDAAITLPHKFSPTLTANVGFTDSNHLIFGNELSFVAGSDVPSSLDISYGSTYEVALDKPLYSGNNTLAKWTTKAFSSIYQIGGTFINIQANANNWYGNGTVYKPINFENKGQ